MKRTSLAGLAGLLWWLLAAGPAGASSAPHPEQQVLLAVEQWTMGESRRALATLEGLLRLHPNFHLARLLYGELLAARAGGSERPQPADTPQLQALLDEARLRFHEARKLPFAGRHPDAIVRLPAHVRHALLVDLAQARLYVLNNHRNQVKVVASYYAGMGKEGAHKQVAGDNRTPVGVYDITGWIAGERLPDLYGAGAFPLNYPNPWDRRHGRTGSGIWVHGVPRDTYVRPPRSSEGCVTLANPDLLALHAQVKPGHTPVILSDGVRWVAPEEAQALRDDFEAQFERWRDRWSARDTENYLDFYAEDFWTEGMDKAAFAAYKRRVNASKEFIEVRIRDLELFRYPSSSSETLMLARFTQHYRSNNYARTSYKQQYWRQERRGWRIIMEETR